MKKRRTSGTHGGGGFAALDEVFHPPKFEVQLELDRQSVLPVPAPVAGDVDNDIYRGTVTIDLGARSES